jgi:hypothetical protein
MNLYPQPQDDIVAEIANYLDIGQREYFEERASIREMDSHFPRGHAESLAMLEVLRRYPSIVTGITALQIELDGGTEWLLITDLTFARQHLADICANEIVVVNLSTVINEQYSGLARLSTLG